MIEQVSTAIQFAAHFVASGVSATGLTVTVDLYRWDGTTVTTIATGAACTEIGSGLYGYSLASGSTANESVYYAVFKTSGTADQQHLPAAWAIGKAGVENLDATVSSRAAASTALSSAVWTNTKAGYIDQSISSLLSTAMAESYGTDGSALTVAQILYLLLAHLGEMSISGTTKTLKKIDGSTTAATFTTNHATNPTSITRSS